MIGSRHFPVSWKCIYTSVAGNISFIKTYACPYKIFFFFCFFLPYWITPDHCWRKDQLKHWLRHEVYKIMDCLNNILGDVLYIPRVEKQNIYSNSIPNDKNRFLWLNSENVSNNLHVGSILTRNWIEQKYPFKIIFHFYQKSYVINI